MSKFLSLFRGFCLLLVASTANAQIAASPWHHNEIDGFSAITLITTDEDWLEIWAQPNDHDVKYHMSSQILMEQTANVIVLFANPMTEDDDADIYCDLEIDERGGSVQGSSESTPCFTMEIVGPIRNWRLAGFRVEFKGEDAADLGLHTFHIGVTDRIRDVRVPLTVSIEIVETLSEETLTVEPLSLGEFLCKC